MLERMAEESIPNGFAQNPTCGSNHPPPAAKKKRNLPGNPDPEAEVIALSPKTLMATNRFICEICGKGFQRDQNLQLHRRGHNLPWKLKQRTTKEVRKRVYVCPEKTCVHHDPSRALGDLTGIKKHFCRKHGEKKWKCDKCSKRYAVQSDWKAHLKTCGTREYRCNCGTIFSRRDSFITHRAFCDALAEETARVTAASSLNGAMANNISYHFIGTTPPVPAVSQQYLCPQIFKQVSSGDQTTDTSNRGISMANINNLQELHQMEPIVSCSNLPPSDHSLIWVVGNKLDGELTSTSIPSNNVKDQLFSVSSLFSNQHHHSHQTAASASMSATALLQKAAQIGSTTSSASPSFVGNLELKCKSNYNQGQDGNNEFCGFYGGNSSITSVNGSDLESSANDISTYSQFHMYPSKRPRTQINEDSSSTAAGGQTRDFLGVGIQSICHVPSSVNGWI
ncbi:hypothetical protein NMG60_11032831 [Bertholletia excelsa]